MLSLETSLLLLGFLTATSTAIDIFLQQNYTGTILSAPDCGNSSFPCVNFTDLVTVLNTQNNGSNNFAVSVAANGVYELCNFTLSGFSSVSFIGMGNSVFAGCASSGVNGLSLSDGSYSFSSINFQGGSAGFPSIFANKSTTTVQISASSSSNAVYSLFLGLNGASYSISDSIFANMSSTAANGTVLSLISGSSGNLQNVTFYNITGYYGGAVSLESGSQFNGTNILCQNTTATRGGCFCVRNSSLLVTFSNFNSSTTAFNNYGGGLYVDQLGSVIVENSTFYKCGAGLGGVVCAITADVTLRSCTGIQGKNTGGIGGVIYSNSVSTLNVEYCTFSGNSGGQYGGLYIRSTKLNFFNSYFSQNSGSNDQEYTFDTGSVGLLSGCSFTHTGSSPINVINTASNLTFINCQFQNIPFRAWSTSPTVTFDSCLWNKSFSGVNQFIIANGGSVTLRNSIVENFFSNNYSLFALSAISDGTFILNQCVFKNNYAPTGVLFGITGGSNQSTTGKVIITDSFFYNNEATSGGLIYLNSPNANFSITFTNNYVSTSQASNGGFLWANNVYQQFQTLSNCTFVNNGGAKSKGGLFYLDSSYIQISNCSFSNQSANDGGFMYLQSSVNTSSVIISSSTITSSFANSSGGAFYFGYSNASMSVSMWNTSVHKSRATYGGAFHYAKDSAPLVLLYNSSVNQNTALQNGGAAYIASNSNPFQVLQSVSFNNNSVTFNTSSCNSTSGSGGAFYVTSCSYLLGLNSSSISNTTFSSNSATRYGGAFGFPCEDLCTSSNAQILSTVFELDNNTASYGNDFGTNMKTVYANLENETLLNLTLFGVRPFVPISINASDSFGTSVIDDLCPFQVSYFNISGINETLSSNWTYVNIPAKLNDLVVYNPALPNETCGDNFTFSVFVQYLNNFSYTGMSKLIFCNLPKAISFTSTPFIFWKDEVYFLTTVIVANTIGIGLLLALTSNFMQVLINGKSIPEEYSNQARNEKFADVWDALDFCHFTVVLGFIASSSGSAFFNGSVKALSWTFGTIATQAVKKALSRSQMRQLLNSVNAASYELSNFQTYAELIGLDSDEIFLSVLFIFLFCYGLFLIAFSVSKMLVKLATQCGQDQMNVQVQQQKMNWIFLGSHFRIALVFFSGMSLTAVYELTALDKGFIDFLAGCALVGCICYLIFGSWFIFRLSPSMAAQPKCQAIFGS
jgi:hypothetical protein